MHLNKMFIIQYIFVWFKLIINFYQIENKIDYYNTYININYINDDIHFYINIFYSLCMNF